MVAAQTIQRLIAYTFIAVACCASTSCDGSSKDDAKKPAKPREINVSADNVSVINIDSYYSANRYGPTQKFYVLADQNAVVRILIDNETDEFNTTVTIYLFDLSLHSDDINKWLNNQYSDGLYSDAPIPTGVYELSANQYSINSYRFIDHTIEEFGDEYDNYDLEIHVDDASAEGAYTLKAFVANTVVHVQTKEIDLEKFN